MAVPPPGWDETPGARGCTPQSCGLSAQMIDDQLEAAERLGLPHEEVVADPQLRLAETLRRG